MGLLILIDFDIARQRSDKHEFPSFGFQWAPFFMKFPDFWTSLQVASDGFRWLQIHSKSLFKASGSFRDPSRLILRNFIFSNVYHFCHIFYGFLKKLTGYRSNQKTGRSFSDQATNFMKEKFLRC